jgi:hypothetical protein
MAAIAPVPTETATRRSWLFLHRYRKAHSSTIESPAGAWRRSVENRAAFSTNGLRCSVDKAAPLSTLRATGYGLRATGYGLRATGYGLRATGYGLRAFLAIQPKLSGWRIAPFSRASASVVEWVEPHGCGERSSGPWTAHLDRPRNGAGVSET